MEESYLVQIPFTITSKLRRSTYVFIYKGRAFRIVRTRIKRYTDNLLTVVDTRSEINLAATLAAEFFSALAWETRGKLQFGNPSWSSHGRPVDIRTAKPNYFGFEMIPPGSESYQNSIAILPHVETDHQRQALALYREARASNNEYLRFLFFWQVLSVGTKGPIEVANKLRKSICDETWLRRLDLRGRSIGNYFDDDCRNAIAHVLRRPGETIIDFDNMEHRIRIYLSAKAVEQFARHHIEGRLGMTKSLYLYKEKRGAIPEFLPTGQGYKTFVGHI